MSVDSKRKEIRPLSRGEIGAMRADLASRLFKEMRNIFRARYAQGLTQKDIATKLGKDPGQVSRCLKGEGNITLNTVADYFLAMDAHLVVEGALREDLEVIENNQIYSISRDAIAGLDDFYKNVFKHRAGNAWIVGARGDNQQTENCMVSAVPEDEHDLEAEDIESNMLLLGFGEENKSYVRGRRPGTRLISCPIANASDRREPRIKA